MSQVPPIAQQVWDMKYRLRNDAGKPVDKTVEETWERVAKAVAEAEPPPHRAAWAERFRAILDGYRFLPAGRILAGAGSGRTVTLFNCFVMGAVPDSMAGIFDALKDAALTMQQGGGIGTDFSTLRPKGAPVRGVAADASGPVSFMEVWDAMCRTILSAGTRRGAMMACLRCDHPDIEAFIDAKREPGRLRMFNLSVLITDAFMRAVEEDAAWDLVFDGTVHRTLPARALWDRILRATYAYAEPGVIFIDRVNRLNNLWYCEKIYATNPCGEQPLPAHGTCLLGSINLAVLVERPFEADASLDEAALEDLAATAVRFLDDVIDVSGFPLPAQRAEALAKRRIGLGVTGLADALIMLGVRYGSDHAVALVERWMARLRRAAVLASVDLAREKGPFPLFDADKYLAGETAAALDEDLRAAIAAHGIRNALLTSIAPTGTISLFAGNVSSGIEPVFAFTATRKVLHPDGAMREEVVADHAWRLYRRLKGEDAPLTDAFVAVADLTPRDHLVMQAAAQKFVDSSISKTINVPETIPFEAFGDVYRQAWDLGCKGCTTYRPNTVTGAVLSAAPAAPPGDADGPPLARPADLPGITYKVRWPESDHALYITINDIEVDDPARGRHRRPFEVFINSKNMEHYAWTVALTRMISAVFRRGGEVAFVVEELKAVFDPRGGQWMDGRYVPSLLAAIGDVIERHMIAIGFLDAPAETNGGAFRRCPKCGQRTLARQEGCDTCSACGYSRCG
ncbi:adenosylcobalamin-dependent ribonucleoside-diphosphate reductase [Novispirillum sp. DQ9]|uniref:adenosylcobalamin-dependent ribonucleoside-diphosphate reductase n=1 Tax=Novispirillum sp. DQ9 TaxID=3398612 RepID=UPI003C7EBCC9